MEKSLETIRNDSVLFELQGREKECLKRRNDHERCLTYKS